MGEKLTYWLIGVMPFLVYMIILLIWVNPPSWSDTFYTLEKKIRRNAGYILMFIEWCYAFFMAMIIIETRPLMLIPVAAILFLGVAADFKGSKDSVKYKTHMTGSISSVVSALIVIPVSYHSWIFAAISAVSAIIIGLIYFKFIKVENYIRKIESYVIFYGSTVILIYDVLFMGVSVK